MTPEIFHPAGCGFLRCPRLNDPLSVRSSHLGHDTDPIMPVSPAISTQAQRSTRTPTLTCPKEIVDFRLSRSFIAPWYCRHESAMFCPKPWRIHPGTSICPAPLSHPYPREFDCWRSCRSLLWSKSRAVWRFSSATKISILMARRGRLLAFEYAPYHWVPYRDGENATHALAKNSPRSPPFVQNHISGTEVDPRKISKKMEICPPSLRGRHPKYSVDFSAGSVITG